MRHIKATFMLLALSSVYRLLLLLLLTGAVQGALFCHVLNGQLALGTPGLETCVDDSRLIWIFAISALLMGIIISAVGCDLGSRQSYTWKRLPVTEVQIFLCQTVYNCLCFFLLWAVELLITYVLCLLYTQWVPETFLSNQTIMLAYYRSPFLHSILPLSDALMWLRNLFLILGYGLLTALIPSYERRHRKQKQGEKPVRSLPGYFAFLVIMLYHTGVYFTTASQYSIVFASIFGAGSVLLVLYQFLIADKEAAES